MTDDDETPTTYSHSPRPVGYPVLFSLGPGRLVVDSGRKVTEIRLDAVEEARLSYEPGRLGHKQFRTKLRLKDGRSVTYTSLTWKGVFEARQQAREYREFTAALMAEIARRSPSARFAAGRPTSAWLLMGLFAALMMGGLVWVLWRSVDKGALGFGALAAAVTLVGIWQLEPMLRLNKPRRFDPARPPAELMP